MKIVLPWIAGFKNMELLLEKSSLRVFGNIGSLAPPLIHDFLRAAILSYKNGLACDGIMHRSERKILAQKLARSLALSEQI